MMNCIEILIVENDFSISEEILSRLIERKYEIIKTVFTVSDAINILTKRLPDIVLIDVSLQNKENVFELANVINKEFHIPFIFLASLDMEKFLNKAKKMNPGAILIEPYNVEQLKVSIEVSLTNFINKSSFRDSFHEKQVKQYSLNSLNQCLFLKRNKHFEKVCFTDIFWLRADSNYTIIHTSKGDFMYSTILKHFEKKLPKDQFMRVHRSFIINLSKIEGFEGRMVLIDNQYIPVVKTCKNQIFDMLQVV